MRIPLMPCVPYLARYIRYVIKAVDVNDATTLHLVYGRDEPEAGISSRTRSASLEVLVPMADHPTVCLAREIMERTYRMLYSLT